MSDIRAQKAREHHQMAGSAEAEAARHRIARNRLICQLRDEDPAWWTHRRLATAIGCTPQLISYILSGASGLPA